MSYLALSSYDLTLSSVRHQDAKYFNNNNNRYENQDRTSVAKSFELQGAANSSPTRKYCSEGAQFLFVLKRSARKSKSGRYLGIFQWNTPKYQYWATKQLERVNIQYLIFRSIQVVIHCQTSHLQHLDWFGVTFKAWKTITLQNRLKWKKISLKRTPRVKPLKVAQFLARRTATFQGSRQLAKAPNCAGKPRRWQHWIEPTYHK